MSDRTGRVRRTAGLALLSALAMTLAAACGVRPSGVIAAGEPAVAQQAVPQTTVYLARGMTLVPVRRPPFPGAPQAALYALWERGPTSQESRQGLWNPMTSVYGLDVRFADGGMEITYAAGSASELTLAQIVCSATAQPGVRWVRVVRSRDGHGRARTMRCEQFDRYMSR